jgi:hypothetical protein
MRLWFSNLILHSAALTLAAHYAPFTDIGGAVMKMLAEPQIVGDDLDVVPDQLIARHITKRQPLRN